MIWTHLGHYLIAALLFRMAIMEARRCNRVGDWFAAACAAAGVAMLSWWP